MSVAVETGWTGMSTQQSIFVKREEKYYVCNRTERMPVTGQKTVGLTGIACRYLARWSY